MTRNIISAILVSAALSAFAEKRPFELYQPIIDRCPFGQPPPDFDPTSSPTASGSSQGVDEAAPEVPLSQQQEALQKSVNATALLIDSTRTVWVGFSDLSDPKSPRTHYMAVGTSEDGWLAKSADPEKKTVTLEKDGVEIEVVVGAGSSTGAKADAAGAGQQSRRGFNGGRGPMRSPLLSGRGGEGGDGGRSMRSLRQMRRDREEAEALQVAEARKAREEAQAEERKRREEEEKQREQEKAEREAERAAEREEYRERLKNLAADLEKRMEENRKAESEREGGEDDE